MSRASKASVVLGLGGLAREAERSEAAAELVKLSGRSVASVADARALPWPDGGGNF